MHKNWGKTIRYIFHLCASFSPRDTLKECIFTQKTPEIHLKQKEDTPKYVSQYLSLHTRKSFCTISQRLKVNKKYFPAKNSNTFDFEKENKQLTFVSEM